MPKAASSDAPKKRTTKKTSTTARAKKAASATRARKAPTQQSSASASSGVSMQMKFIGALVLGLVVTLGVSYFIGTSDQGVINVSSVIGDRADKAAAEGNTAESEEIRTIEKQARMVNDLPNGGLVGAGNSATRQQQMDRTQSQKTAQSASSTASSTPETATSTEETTAESEEDTTETTEEAPAEDGVETSADDTEAPVE